MPTPEIQKLNEQHTDEAIAARIAATTQHGFVGDFVLGGVDGAITTFAIVAGVAGANYPVGVALVLGVANVLADGFSMAVSNYLKVRADKQVLEQYRRMEEFHITHLPDREREEIRQIFAAKGFSGELLEQVVETICDDQQRWVDTMLVEEWGLQIAPPSPWKAGLVTFCGFLLAGAVPLLPLPLMYWGVDRDEVFALCAIVTMVAFALIGVFRGKVVGHSTLVSVVETVATGGLAAAIAYGAGVLLERLVGGSG
ncbi:MAG: VIT1/CCC1 transporter family protein [Pirellulaceae bacterium]